MKKKTHVFLLKIFTSASSHSFFSVLLYSYEVVLSLHDADEERAMS